MRRTIEIGVIVLFLAVGAMLVSGRLSLPQLEVDLGRVLPAGASEAATVSCSTCSADCPYAAGASEKELPPTGSLEPVSGTLLGEEELRREFPALAEVPLCGGAVAGYRAEQPHGEPRIWLDIGTCSPTGEAAEWYREQLRQAGWEMIRDDDTTVADAIFLSFGRSAKVINVLIEERSDRTNLFLDLPRDP